MPGGDHRTAYEIGYKTQWLDDRLQVNGSFYYYEGLELLLQAARLLREHVGQPDLAADICLCKRIPMGGGLGGGSSNAAMTLLAATGPMQAPNP